MNRKLMLLIMGLVLALPFNTSASTVTFLLDNQFGGNVTPAGVPPWVVASFDDGGSAGSVTLTLTTPELSGSEFLSAFAFNVDPNINPTSINFSNEDTTDVGADPNFVLLSRGINGVSLFGSSGPLFNIKFQFVDNDFTPNETYSIDLSYPGITAASFNFPNNFPSGLPVGGATITTNDPGLDYSLITTTIPIPPALWLFGSGLLGLIGIARRKKSA